MSRDTTPEAGMRLAPCPFCGGEPRRMSHADEWIKCDECGAEGPSEDTEDEATEAWNTRAAAPVPPAGGEGEAQLRFMSANLRDIEGTEDFLIHYHERVLVADNIDAALAARAQPPVGEVNLAAMREYAVAMTKKHGNPIGTDYEQGQTDMGHRWVHSFDGLLSAHPAEPAARLGSSAAPIPTEQADGPVVAAEEPEHASGCGYTGRDFGASYPDSTCIDGYLWDLDSCDEPGQGLTQGGDIPCPKCNHEGAVQ